MSSARNSPNANPARGRAGSPSCFLTKRTQSNPRKMFANLHECSQMFTNVHPNDEHGLRNEPIAGKSSTVSKPSAARRDDAQDVAARELDLRLPGDRGVVNEIRAGVRGFPSGEAVWEGDAAMGDD